MRKHARRVVEGATCGTDGQQHGTLFGFAGEYRDVLLSRGRNALHVSTTYRHINELLHLMGKPQPVNLTRSALERALGAIRKKGRSAQTVKHYLTSFRAFCRWAADEDNGYLPKDPTRNLKLPSAERDRRHIRRAMSEAELVNLLDVTAHSTLTLYNLSGQDWAERYHALVCLGVRMGTLAKLRVGQFTLTGPGLGLQLYGDQEKAGKERFIPLRPDSAERIAAYLASKLPTALAFPVPDKDKSLLAYKKHLALAGINYCDLEESGGVVRRRNVVDLHAMRHTYGTRLARAGVPIKVAQALMGHSDPKLTMNIYSHVTHNDSSAALDLLPAIPAQAG